MIIIFKLFNFLFFFYLSSILISYYCLLDNNRDWWNVDKFKIVNSFKEAKKCNQNQRNDKLSLLKRTNETLITMKQLTKVNLKKCCYTISVDFKKFQFDLKVEFPFIGLASVKLQSVERKMSERTNAHNFVALKNQ